MDFPKRIKQHKSQSDSFAILLYQLKDLGIFRNVTENDYGIDFEIEIVHNDKLIGKYLKAQVKSAEEIYIREDGIPTVGGIKQSTLLYWAELCYRIHVVVFAVDLTSEKVYFTRSIFWQATYLLDKSANTKTLEFVPPIKLPKADKNFTLKKKKAYENSISTLFVKKLAFSSSISDIIFAHRMLLRHLNLIFVLYTETWHYDPWTEVQSLDMFKIVLECSEILVELPDKIDDLEETDRFNFFNFDYWAKKTDWSYDDVSNEVAKIPLKIIMPLLLDQLQNYSELVLRAYYYWKSKDMLYLKLVHQTIIPKTRTHDEIVNVNYNGISLQNQESFSTYMFRIEK